MDQRVQAAVFVAPNAPLELRMLPRPRLAQGELLVRVSMTTLCGSDLHSYSGRRPAPAPSILGHEIVGEVVQRGPGQPPRDLSGQAIELGQRITWSLCASCGDCFFCKADLPQKCERLFKYGHEAIRDGHALSGGLAEYCHLVPGTAIVSLPETLTDPIACPASCATATIAAALRVGRMSAGETVLIQGCGMLGLTACALCTDLGAKDVIATDLDPERLATARAFGATFTAQVEPDATSPSAEILERTEGRGVDLALELSGAASACHMTLKSLRIGGRCVWVGAVLPTGPIGVDPETIVRRQLSVFGQHNYLPADLQTAVEFLARSGSRFPFVDLVPQTFLLQDANAAIHHALQSSAPRVAVARPR